MWSQPYQPGRLLSQKLHTVLCGHSLWAPNLVPSTIVTESDARRHSGGTDAAGRPTRCPRTSKNGQNTETKLNKFNGTPNVLFPPHSKCGENVMQRSRERIKTSLRAPPAGPQVAEVAECLRSISLQNLFHLAARSSRLCDFQSNRSDFRVRTATAHREIAAAGTKTRRRARHRCRDTWRGRPGPLAHRAAVAKINSGRDTDSM